MTSEQQPAVGSCYRHYKGDLYTVVGIALHHETRQELVLYRSHKNGWVNARPLHGTPADPDGWLTPGPDGRTRFQQVHRVLLLEEPDGSWIAMCNAASEMREVRGPTIEITQATVRYMWDNPLPLRFPEDFPLMDHEFESLVSHGTLHQDDGNFMWYVVDVAGRENALRDQLEQGREEHEDEEAP